MRSTPARSGRRTFLQSMSLMLASRFAAASPIKLDAMLDSAGKAESLLDAQRMRSLADWTMQTMSTPNPVPYGAEIFHTVSGQSLMRATNAVGPERDPSAHGEVAAIRLACRKLGSPSLRGYTLYTTCEPCVMCMGCCLWAGLDRVVFGATFEDAARYGHEIMISAAEVQRRSDMRCRVTGPVERDHCLLLFTNPAMQDAFKRWRTR